MHKTSLKAHQVLIDKNIALQKMGYWYDVSIDEWTNRDKTDAEKTKHEDDADLYEKAFNGDTNAAIKLMKRMSNGKARKTSK